MVSMSAGFVPLSRPDRAAADRPGYLAQKSVLNSASTSV
jgi:hypothetical protein